MQGSHPEAVTLADILITEELAHRTCRAPNLQAENQAMRMLIHQMAQASEALLQSLVDTALELCAAGTTGVSLLETTADGEEIFRWNALAGTLAHQAGGSTPRDFSPCGVCLAQGTPVLFSHPEHYFTYFQQANTPIVESLVLPLIADTHIFGTIWIMSHDEQRQFDSEDVRVMTSLAAFTATALLLQQHQTRELLAANAALEIEVVERKQAEEQTHAFISNLPGGAAFVVDRDLRYLLAEGEALAIAGFKPEDLIGRTIFEVLPSELATRYERFYRQALAGEPFEIEHHSHHHWYITRGAPLRSPNGDVYAVLAVSFDITERKRVEDDRKQVEDALRQSEEKYRSLFESIDEGFAIVEVFPDEHGCVTDLIYREANEAFGRHSGMRDFIGKQVSEILPNLEQHWLDMLTHIYQTGEPARMENYIAELDRWLDVRYSRVGDAGSRQVTVVFEDITQRKRFEQRQAFLLQLSDALRSLSDAVEIQATVTRTTMNFFGADRCYYCEIIDGSAIIRRDASQADLPTVVGVYPLHNSPIFKAMIDAGQSFIVRDAHTTNVLDENLRQTCLQFQIISFINVPVIKQGKPVGILCITKGTPRNWTAFDMDLAEEIADRTWETVERARAEAAIEDDLRDTQRLHDLATRLVLEDDRQAIYQEIVKTAIALTQADAGSFQILDETTQELVLIATQGIDQRLTEHFYRLDARSNTSCGITLATGERTFITFDVPESQDPDGSLRMHKDAGLCCAQSTPLRSRSGKPIGMVSTHWREEHQLSDRELRFLDLLARQAADLIEQRQAQVVLRESEARLQSIANLVPDLLWDSEPDGLTNWYNQRWMEYTGQTFEQAVGWGWIDAIHPDDLATSTRRYHEAVQQGVQLQQEHRIRRYDGEYRWFVVKVSPLKDEGGRVVKMYGAATDIHDQRVALEALRESEERQQIALEAAKMGTFVWFPQEDRGEPDARMLALFGLHEGDVLNLAAAIATMIHPDDRDLYTAAVTQAIDPSGNGKLYAEIRVIHPDTSLHWLAITAQTYFEGQPLHPVRMYGIAADITSRKQAEANQIRLIQEQAAREQEQQRAESLADLDRAKTQFFSNISHEFRTPLTLILGPLQDALSDPTLAPIHRERLELACRNSLRLLKLVNTLLDFSRIEAGRMEAVYEPTDLALFTSELASVFRSAIEGAGLQLVVDCPPLPEPVYVDREMWEKIVLNLLSNAFKFTFEGTITVSLRAESRVNPPASTANLHDLTSEAQSPPSALPPSTSALPPSTSALPPSPAALNDSSSALDVSPSKRDISPSALDPSSSALKASPSKLKTLPHVILEIRDTGTGIAPEHLPHLFERFYQVRSTQARTHDGSGIGLALVHELMQLHGGTLEVSSTVGEGTCFTITLPFGTHHLPSDRLHLEGDRVQPTRTLASTAMGATTYGEEAKRWLSEENGEATSIPTPYPLPPTPHPLPPTPSPARVLLVDDNADMREYLTRILSQHVYVEAIAEGATALAVAQERVPDLILSDVMMPGLDGFELLTALRADPRTREVPILLLSARAGEEAIVEGLAAGADDYLIKPFSAQELVSRVTAQLQMAQLRRETLQQERTMNHRKDEFISVVSHELNTPLVSILGWTRMLRSSPPNPVMLSKALDTIERNATLQAKLVQDLLDISRITAGKLRLNPQPIELKPVIETAIATVAHTATNKDIHLAWQDEVTQPLVVMGDSDRLTQVFTNLLNNAIKFTPEGERVEIRLSLVIGHQSFVEETRPATPDEPQTTNDQSQRTNDKEPMTNDKGPITNDKGPMTNDKEPMTNDKEPMTNDKGPMTNDPYAEIRVTDTGIGIAADFLPHIFDRFQQARSTDAAKGLGLGLAIAQHLVNLHNGTLQAHSAGPGQGSTFIVRLPLLPAPSQDRTSQDS